MNNSTNLTISTIKEKDISCSIYNDELNTMSSDTSEDSDDDNYDDDTYDIDKISLISQKNYKQNRSPLQINDPIKLMITNIISSFKVEDIYTIIENLNIGKIYGIDIINSFKNTKDYCVEFEYWNPLDLGAKIRQKIQSGKSIVLYSTMNHKIKWVCYNKNRRYDKPIVIKKKNPYINKDKNKKIKNEK